MSAPKFVPAKAVRATPAVYASPPSRPGGWRADRPGDGGLRKGTRLGAQGPDQGYALTLADFVRDELTLTGDEKWEDVRTLIAAVGMRRASIFGRAPVIHDLRLAAGLFGYDLADAPGELVDYRRDAASDTAHVHHYDHLRDVVDRIDDDTLRLTPHSAAELRESDWRSAVGAE